MPYTVWSRDRLIGHSELAYRRQLPGMLGGDFFPSEAGEQLMPIIVGVGPALCALHEFTDDLRRRNPAVELKESGDWSPVIRGTTAYADAVSSHDERESLNLELRDPDGSVIKTEWINIQDTYRLMARAREEMEAEGLEPFEDDEPEPWEPELPRYQIMVALEGHEQRMLGLAGRPRKLDQ